MLFHVRSEARGKQELRRDITVVLAEGASRQSAVNGMHILSSNRADCGRHLRDNGQERYP